MPRRKITESSTEVAEMPLTKDASNDMLVMTAVIGFFIGIILTYIGRRGKQMYLWVWGAGLVVFSIYLGVTIVFDWTLFEHF